MGMGRNIAESTCMGMGRKALLRALVWVWVETLLRESTCMGMGRKALLRALVWVWVETLLREYLYGYG